MCDNKHEGSLQCKHYNPNSSFVMWFLIKHVGVVETLPNNIHYERESQARSLCIQSDLSPATTVQLQ